MDPHVSSSGITSQTDFLIFLEKIKTQVNTLGLGTDKIEIEHHDQDRNEDRQPNQHRDDRINRNYDRYEDNKCYQKNIKLDMSNSDDRLDSQYYLDWAMSLE